MGIVEVKTINHVNVWHIVIHKAVYFFDRIKSLSRQFSSGLRVLLEGQKLSSSFKINNEYLQGVQVHRSTDYTEKGPGKMNGIFV